MSGVSLRDRANRNEPMSLYHYYDYYQLKEADVTSDRITCPTSDSCIVSVTIDVRDNWNATSTQKSVDVVVNSN